MNEIQLSDVAGALTPKAIPDTEASQSMAIDFWCEDSKLKQSDKSTGIPTHEINVAMRRLPIQNSTVVPELIDWDLNTITDSIRENHQFIRKNAAVIYDLAQKVAYRHSAAHPQLNEIVTVMFLFLHDLLNHMMREEQILFPNIKQLLKDNSRSEKGMYTTFGLIKEWVKHMQKEHQSSCKNLKLLNELTNNYSTPPDAGNSYRSLLTLMQEFEAGFLLLMNIEDNILFPKALAEDGETD